MPAPTKTAKLSLENLAAFGGTPRFPEALHVGRRKLDERASA